MKGNYRYEWNDNVTILDKLIKQKTTCTNVLRAIEYGFADLKDEKRLLKEKNKNSSVDVA